jgi:hypothetical protein
LILTTHTERIWTLIGFAKAMIAYDVRTGPNLEWLLLVVSQTDETGH